MDFKRSLEDSRELRITGATLLSTEEAEKLCKKNREYAYMWWLRSPGTRNCDTAFVRRDTSVASGGRYIKDSLPCVRPALIIEESPLKIGDFFTIRIWKFKKITKNLAWLYEQDIGQHRFDEKTNIYEQSEIKQFVDDWFEKEITPYLLPEYNFSKVKFEETIGDISYFIVPREWVEDYALSDVFATISLEDDIVRISPTKYDGEQYVDYDWQDFILSEDERNQLKKVSLH